MKRFKTMLFILLFGIATTPLHAGSEDFAGAYISVSVGANGASLTGKHTDEDKAVTEGTGGKTFPMVGAEIGYNIPVSDSFFVTVGYSRNPGRAKISEGDDATDGADVTVTVSDLDTLFIQPSWSMGDSSAVYLKYGSTDATLRFTEVTTSPSSLSGDTWALGTTTLFTNGLFFKTEAGVNLYDEFSVTGIGDSSTATLDADPQQVYGVFSFGYKF